MGNTSLRHSRRKGWRVGGGGVLEDDGVGAVVKLALVPSHAEPLLVVVPAARPLRHSHRRGLEAIV